MRIESEADFDVLLRSSKLLAIASAWQELGIWDALAARDEPAGPADLPGEERALHITGTVLAHAGLLEGDGEKWRLSALARSLHAARGLPTGRNLGFLEDLSRMVEVVREGGPVRGADGEPKVTTGGVTTSDPQATRAFLDMLYRRSETAAEQVVAWMGPRLPRGAHVLDVGGGHGRYALAFAEKGFQATLFDLPLVIELARERHRDRIGYVAGDFHVDALGGLYDAAFLSNIVHGESPAANAKLVRRLHDVLRPGGLLILKD